MGIKMDASMLMNNLKIKLENKGFSVSYLQNFGEKATIVITSNSNPHLKFIISYYNIPLPEGSTTESAEIEILNTISQLIKLVFTGDVVPIGNTMINTKKLLTTLYHDYKLVPLLKIIPEPKSVNTNSNIVINYIIGATYLPDIRKAKNKADKNLYQTVIDEYPITAFRVRKLYEKNGSEKVAVGGFVDFRICYMTGNGCDILLNSSLILEALSFLLYKHKNPIMSNINYSVLKAVVMSVRTHIKKVLLIINKIRTSKLKLIPVHGFEVIPGKSQFIYRLYYGKHMMEKHIVSFKSNVSSSIDLSKKIIEKINMFQNSIIEKFKK